ncbi:hypothetical protein RHMOL_Rhmol05G0226700 [Rhododendron molle]|uniref:Uncharacterized protein n=1 Tax=Rhododendron molle TaxID=49168 RepID=A0ACC0NSZ8_RHOML|nr:hypothetical protein RHMOL_Rhmol05G0226700 [Rhododendron molle]
MIVSFVIVSKTSFSTYTTKLSCIHWSHIQYRSLLFTIFIAEKRSASERNP